MLIDDVKRRAMDAAKAGDTVVRDVLRLAVGELQTAEARAGRVLSEDEAFAVVRKLLKSNEETLALSAEDPVKRTTLTTENAALAALLPATLSIDALVKALIPVADAIRAAKADGQATGVAMKHVRAAGLKADGNDVAAAVKQLRS